MASYSLLFICLAAGYFLRRGGVFGPSAHETLGRFVLWVSLPALTILNLRRVTFDSHLLFGIAMPWLVFFLAALFFRLAKVRDTATFASLTLVCGLGNTSFLGFPMLEALVGPEAIPPASLIDQLGTFFTLAIPGIALASAASVGRPDPRAIVIRILKFPPFWALVAGALSRPIELPESALNVLERLGSTLTPLALASVGCQIDFSRKNLQGLKRPIALGLTYKLALAPAMILGLALLLGLPRDLVFRVTIIEAAMAPMISAGIIAVQFGLRPELASQLVAAGIVVSFATVPIWNAILSFFTS